jgi:hypothetical protein
MLMLWKKIQTLPKKKLQQRQKYYNKWGNLVKESQKKYDRKMWPLNFNIERRHNHYQQKSSSWTKVVSGC